MKVTINAIKVTLEKAELFMKDGVTDEALQLKVIKEVLAEKLKKNLKTHEIGEITILKRSVDARKRVILNYSLCVDIPKVIAEKIIAEGTACEYSETKRRGIHEFSNIGSMDKSDFERPVVAGFGPAGMMCAYHLAVNGLRPIIVERGQKVDERIETVDLFWEKGILNENSNVQFGEGGAGTFSDGKLTSRGKDARSRLVLEILSEFGAGKDILYASKPHVGTDILKDTVKGIRNRIEELGGEFYFLTRLDMIEKINGKRNLNRLVCKDLIAGKNIEFESEYVVTAIGHSARDTFKMFRSIGIKMIPKPFAVGLRIEHRKENIDLSQYGEDGIAGILGASEYMLTHTTLEGRGVYTFCMCPGGMVVPASSQSGGLAVNGMSYHSRNMENSNSAVIVSVKPDDYASYGESKDDPLSGMMFQIDLEMKAFTLGGSGYAAPAQKVGGFLGFKDCRSSKDKSVNPSYPLGVKWVNVKDIFPDFIVSCIREAIPAFGKKLKGFDDYDAVLTGVETRTSSPVRIMRCEESFQSVTHDGVYPCGEGSGYSGGIVSSGVDGIKVAEKIVMEMIIGAKQI